MFSDRLLSRRLIPIKSPLVALLTVVWLAAVSLGCTPQGQPAIGSDGFSEDFSATSLASHWNNTGGPWRVRNGELNVRGARNRPLWLQRRLPRDCRIEFDVRSESPEGDIKVEVFGDGQSRAVQASYTATSYVVIFGGWGNSKNIIARMDEHGSDRVEGPRRPVVQGQTYHFRIERQGDTITAYVDDEELASMTDADPLEGSGHEYFAFNNWESNLFFDNLTIQPL